ncbi:MAG TPA: hypothetical protein PK867_05145 [Pirellulales bacterium]|nr:hypothetical protein [Pirellulales bacterium]
MSVDNKSTSHRESHPVAPSTRSHGPMWPTRPQRGKRTSRRAVILLVVMVVLALFTLLGLTLVLVTA